MLSKITALLISIVSAGCGGTAPGFIVQTVLIPELSAGGLSSAVAINDTYAAAGIPGDDGDNTDSNFNSGALQIFKRSAGGEWAPDIILRPSDPEHDSGFGVSVSMSGNRIIAGAWLTDGGKGKQLRNSGAAYIFEKTEAGSWKETGRLQSSVPQEFEYFGFSAAIDGDSAVVGAYNQNDATGSSADWSGAVYVYEYSNENGWKETGRLFASNRRYEDFFGYSVAINNSTILVGSRCADKTGRADGVNCGAVYIYRKDRSGRWTESQILYPSDPQPNGYFGSSTAVSGNTIFVGAPGRDQGSAENCGAAYVFTQNGGMWKESKRIVPEEPRKNDLFGSCVSVEGGLAAVGTPNRDIRANENRSHDNAGIISVYRKTSSARWMLSADLTAQVPLAHSRLGSGVSVFNGRIAAGSRNGGITFIR